MLVSKNKKYGFTLIEILIVIVILSIISGVFIPRIGSTKGKANDTARISYQNGLSAALLGYQLDHQTFPDIFTGQLGSCSCAPFYDVFGNLLIKYGYAEGSLPKDPVNTSSFNFCGQEVSPGEYVYCKLDNGFLLVSQLELGGGNANSDIFPDGSIIEETKNYDILEKLSNTGDLYIYVS